MSDHHLKYERTPSTTANRLKNRIQYDYETIHSIINASPVVHVSFMPGSIEDDPFPAILPMVGCMGVYTDASSSTNSDSSPAPSLYLHGHVSARLLKLPRSSFTEEHVGEWPKGGHPVAIAATHVDGLVLAYTPFNHSMNYRSAVVHGWAYLVEDRKEKEWAMEMMTDNIIPDRWKTSKLPPTEAQLRTTGVLRVEVVSASAKVRGAAAGGGPNDLEDEEERLRIWRGIIPTWIQYGDPISAPEDKLRAAPGYLQSWINEKNKTGEEYAVRVASLSPS